MKSAEERLKALAEERDKLNEMKENATGAQSQASDPDMSEEEGSSTRRPTVFMDEPEQQAQINKEELPEWETKIDKEKAVFNGLGWLKSVAIGVLIGVLLVVFVIQRNNVYGSSMEPTLYEKDIIFTLKLDTYFDTFDRGDIVTLDGEDMEGYDNDEYLIKRIVGLPGETVKIENGKVFIKHDPAGDFVELNEPYLVPGTLTTVSGEGLAKGYDEITLGSDEYYCLGDNRFVSKDSRSLGPFEADRLKGVAFIRVYPFDSIGRVK